MRAGRAVDQQRVTEDADLAAERLALGEPAVVGERLVLHHHRHVVDPVRVGKRTHVGGRVVDQEHAREPAVDLLLGALVGMRVVPERRGRLVDPPLRREGGAGPDRLLRSAVHAGRQVHAVPVHGGVLAEPVADVDHDLLAACGPQRRTEMRAVEAPGGGRRAAAQVALPGLRAQVEHPPPGPVDARGGQRWHGEPAVEADAAHGVQRRPREHVHERAGEGDAENEHDGQAAEEPLAHGGRLR
jgi:hypothetical protein